MGTRGRALRVLIAVCCLAAALCAAPSAQAASGAPHWMVITQPAPTYFHSGDKNDFYEIMALNDGGAASSGKITLKDTLPSGLVVTSAVAQAANESINYGAGEEMACTTTTGVLTTVECETESSVPIGDRVIAKIDVEVSAGAAGPLANQATVEGGGALTAATTSTSTPIKAASEKVPYGVRISAEATTEDGKLATQAGSHPFAFSTLLAENIGSVTEGERCAVGVGGPRSAGCAEITAATKDLEVQLPAGFVGNPLSTPQCTQEQFQESSSPAGCPASTQVGDVYLSFYGSLTSEQYAPIYNVEPPPGQPAELGFVVGEGVVHIPMFFHVRTGGDYGLTVDLNEISTFDAVRMAALMIWGVPGAEAHNPMRDSILNKCGPGEKEGTTRGCGSEVIPAKPFLTMPSRCTGQPLALPLQSDSWQELGVSVQGAPEASMPPVTGCESLSFAPEAHIETTTKQAGVPAGYKVHLRVPQDEAPSDLATPDVQNVELELPEGTTISPSGANGLKACSDSEFGLNNDAAAKCPKASSVGSVKISTPLLAQPLTGEVFVGEPQCSPCSPSQAETGQMVRLFIQAQGSGVLVKLAGDTKINNTTGRLTTVFTENPQLPFDELEVALDDGPNAPLTNPTTCGPAVAHARMQPWSSNLVSDITASGPPGIEGCTAPGFAPSVVAGMNGSSGGGSFGSFAVTISRSDGQQDIGTVELHTPPGLAGLIAKVPLCAEAAANAGTCGAASQIGEATTAVGVGSEPYVVHGGKVYLTGPYGGGPFGLSIVVPAEAGPYRLAGENGTGGEGNGSVVIRGSIKVDPVTAAITIATNPIPTQLDGIPLHLQKVIVNVNREGFMFSPTNCDATSVESTIASSSGASVSSKYPFQATNCASLPFKPGFAVTTHAGHTRKNGAYLHVKVTSGTGQANIKQVYVVLPRVLPSRTETLKEACSEAQFAQNPAGCPAGSHVGTAVAHTPVLPVPLTGPAIFVSHGGAKFPDLDVVLQGDGVTVDLTGHTDISGKPEITSSNFNTVPDVPVSSFELTLPPGPHSALAGTANFCTKTVSKRVKTKVHRKVVYRTHTVKQKQTLEMPTTIVGQNGATIKKTTKLTVQGCAATNAKGKSSSTKGKSQTKKSGKKKG